jgi:hypothetical protein
LYGSVGANVCFATFDALSAGVLEGFEHVAVVGKHEYVTVQGMAALREWTAGGGNLAIDAYEFGLIFFLLSLFFLFFLFRRMGDL